MLTPLHGMEENFMKKLSYFGSTEVKCFTFMDENASFFFNLTLWSPTKVLYMYKVKPVPNPQILFKINLQLREKKTFVDT